MMVTSKITGFTYKFIKINKFNVVHLKQLTADDINKNTIGRIIKVSQRRFESMFFINDCN